MTSYLRVKNILENVSRETLEKLRLYQALLEKWQKAVNLVSPQTLPAAWERHFEDSAQLSAFLPCSPLLSPRKRGPSKTDKKDPRLHGEDKIVLLDFGSGAGFPGLVLAILHPEIEVHLVESDEKKGQFLRNVSRETSTPVTIHTQRIEALSPETLAKIRPDIITARALADLATLCRYALPYAENNPDLVLLFPKGEKATEEIKAAEKEFSFTLTAHPSRTNPAARILEIRNLRKV